MRKLKKGITSIILLAMLSMIMPAFAAGYDDPHPPTVSNVYINTPSSTGWIKTASITFNLANVQDPEGVLSICATISGPDNQGSKMYWLTKNYFSNWSKTINMADFNYSCGYYNITYIIYDNAGNFTTNYYMFRYDKSEPRFDYSNISYLRYTGGALDFYVFVNDGNSGSGIRRVRLVLNKRLPQLVPMDCSVDAVCDNDFGAYHAVLDTNYFGNTPGTYSVKLYAYDYAGNVLNKQIATLEVVN